MIINQIVLNNLVYNEAYMRECLPHLKAGYFRTVGEQHVFGLIDEFVNEYGVAPTPEVLVVKLERSKLSESIYTEALQIVTEMEPSNDNFKWLRDETEAWAKDRALANAVRRAVRIYGGEEKDGDANMLPEMFQEALSVSFSEDMGHVYWEMASKQFDEMREEGIKVPFGADISYMNDITRGGVETKSLNIVLAGINTGKTTWLIDRAMEQVELGKNVFYFTLEIQEKKIRHRADARILGMEFDRLEKMTKPEYLAAIEMKHRKATGQLFIKEYAPGTAHIGHFRHYITQIYRKYGIKPDMIIIDYITEAISSRLPIHMIGNTNTYFGSVAREFRTLGFEYEVPVWTAMQLQRDKQDGLGGKIGDVADAISIPKIADFMITIGREEADVLLKQCTVTQTKSRYDDKDKMRTFRLGLDNSRQKFFNCVGESLPDPTISVADRIRQSEKRITTGNNPTLNEADSVLNWDFSQ